MLIDSLEIAKRLTKLEAPLLTKEKKKEIIDKIKILR